MIQRRDQIDPQVLIVLFQSATKEELQFWQKKCSCLNRAKLVISPRNEADDLCDEIDLLLRYYVCSDIGWNGSFSCRTDIIKSAFEYRLKLLNTMESPLIPRVWRSTI
jgi:hypothetical protein